MLATTREVDTTFSQGLAKRVERDFFASRHHILKALNECHAAEVQEDMTSKLLIEGDLITTETIELVADLCEGAFPVDDTVRD
ncbi:hypothetical protein ACFSKM_12985 [Ancylobacter dichloromethanicus]